MGKSVHCADDNISDLEEYKKWDERTKYHQKNKKIMIFKWQCSLGLAFDCVIIFSNESNKFWMQIFLWMYRSRVLRRCLSSKANISPIIHQSTIEERGRAKWMANSSEAIWHKTSFDLHAMINFETGYFFPKSFEPFLCKKF